MYHHNCIGREDISARQGYCCYAETITGAVLDMVDRFPDEVLHGFTLTNTETDRHYSWDIVNGIKPAPDGVLDINPRVQGNLDLLEGDRTIEKFLNIMRKKRFFLRKMKQCY
jgi:hypothetical protein